MSLRPIDDTFREGACDRWNVFLTEGFCNCLAGIAYVFEYATSGMIAQIDRLLAPPTSIQEFRASIIDLEGDARAKKCAEFVRQLLAHAPRVQITHQRDTEIEENQMYPIKMLLRNHCSDIPELKRAFDEAVKTPHPHNL